MLTINVNDYRGKSIMKPNSRIVKFNFSVDNALKFEIDEESFDEVSQKIIAAFKNQLGLEVITQTKDIYINMHLITHFEFNAVD